MKDYSEILPITSIQIKKVSKTYTGVLAYVSICLADCIAIHNIKVVEVRDRHTKELKRILAFPNRKLESNELNGARYSDVVHPTNSEYRKYIESLIFRLYDNGEVNNE